MPVPPAEVRITEDVVRALLRAQLPALADRPLRLEASGWDNEMWRLGDDLAVRLPRRALGVELLGHERRWLPLLASRLPVAIPVPVHLGEPAAGYPWPWTVVGWVPGTTVDRAGGLSARGAAALGATLAALHLPADAGAPFNPGRSVELRDRPRSPTELVADLDAPLRAGLDAVWQDAIDAPAAPTRSWIHGDLHVRNLVCRDGDLAAVLDWGDLCAGDPAVDLGVRWTVLDPATVAAFDAAYGPIDAALQARARGWAALFAAIVVDTHRHDEPEWAAWAQRALHRVAADHTPGRGA